jgi:rfaE bifunctional protein kinase chain/domain
MNRSDCEQWTSRYAGLRIAVVGDFCLDRYFDIDPLRSEVSLETGLPVHNVTGIRCFAGAAGTIVNNLAALGAAKIWPIGLSGDDAEGWALRRALGALPGVDMAHFVTSDEVKTFTYSKPLLHRTGQPPEELSRLDLKNWLPTPQVLERKLASALDAAVAQSDAVIVLDQVDIAGTGVVTPDLLADLGRLIQQHPALVVIGDSRRSLAGWPSMVFKMNARELGLLSRRSVDSLGEIQSAVESLAGRNRRAAFVTLAERGIVGALPDSPAIHVPSRPVRGPIDIVGAGDSVTANLAMAMAAGLPLRESMELAMAGASHVIHQLGTTGTASIADLQAFFP